MSERQEPYITSTPVPDYLSNTAVVVLTKREEEFIAAWRRNPKARALAVDPAMGKLWDKLCQLYSMVRKREAEPIVVLDMMRLEAYTLNDI